MKKMREIMIVFIVVVIAVACNARAAEPIKTHVVGEDGLCLDSGGPSRYNFPRVVPCKDKEDTQLWTFPEDGTIRWSNDRCLFPYGMLVLKEYIFAKTGICNELQHEDKTWILNNQNGSIIHVHSGLVLTVQNNSKYVNVEPNRNDSSQIWDAVDRHDAPRIGYIMGLYSYKCLSFVPNYPVLRSHNCSRYPWSNEMWALFGDSTIRANADKSLCMTSFRRTPYYVLAADKCRGKAEQQWEMDFDDFTIHHPGSNLVVDLITIGQDPDLLIKPQIVTLFTRNGASTQKWTFVE